LALGGIDFTKENVLLLLYSSKIYKTNKRIPALNDPYSTDNKRILSKALTLAGIEHLQKQCLYGYYPDFIFPGHKLIVEVDSHMRSGNLNNKVEHKDLNKERDAHLSQLGYQIVRYSNQAVKNCTKGVVLSIQRHLLAS
jgi:very-short-patch-repair endonuclease